MNRYLLWQHNHAANMMCEVVTGALVVRGLVTALADWKVHTHRMSGWIVYTLGAAEQAQSMAWNRARNINDNRNVRRKQYCSTLQ